MIDSIALGIDEERFWQMNPHRITLVMDGLNKKAKQDFEMANAIAYTQGLYFCDALLSTVGNMFSDKSSKKFEYPKKPYDFGSSGEMTEDEMQMQRDLLVARYMTMMNNFNLTHEFNGQEQGS